MYISEEQRKFLIIASAAVIFLVVDIFFILKPMFAKTWELNQRIGSINKDVDELKRKISTLDSAKGKLGALKSEYENYEKRFPKADEIPSLFETLSTIAVKSKVGIVAVRPMVAEKGPAAKVSSLYQEIPIEIRAKGGYHQLGDFINKMEMLNRFMEVKDIEITREDAAAKRENLRLLVSTYILLRK